MSVTEDEKRIDRIVGQNIRMKRTQRKMSQETVGKALGVTFQQVQKIEKGVNRIGAGRLALLASVLDCDVMDLYSAPKGDPEATHVLSALLEQESDEQFLDAVSALPIRVKKHLSDLVHAINDPD